MNRGQYNYTHRKLVTIAGILALTAMVTAVVYELHSTPLTMILFLAGGSGLLLTAAALFGWAIWRDINTRLQSISSKQFSAGEVIFRQGDEAEHVFVITKGEVEAFFSDPVHGEILLGRLRPSEFFGETAILTQSPRQATARAVDEVQTLMVHRSDFLRLYGSLPRLRKAIEAVQSQRQTLLNSQRKG